ncbi:hypothetical protein FSP39_002114 [Pinctada imbricata]|uniref:Peroxisomal membrane protein PEX13 n=1 Tax=Pinctada imbricata TaxID=66713 RepID=A0AA88XY69_PINIB|nr:hypothetical protein FSP39_002114 [Pinctada imbricata]
MGYGGYSPYSSPYSSYGMGGYGGMGSYGSYSPYSSMYGGYGSMGGYGNDYMGSSIARQAEESSRPAFQSIESIVHAFTSVSMMLDSTFQAVYNSFRAVIGVADNFTRLKTQFAQVFSAFAVIRFLRYLYRRLLVLLRLRHPGSEEEVWKEATDVLGQIAGDTDGPKKSTWPIMMFFAVILGGPWLIWKMISSLTDVPGKLWMTGEDDHFVAKANFDFSANGQEELSFKAGQEIRIAPKELQPRMKGWLLGSLDGKKVGIIPANYVKVLGKKRGSRSLQGQGNQLQPTLPPPHQGSNPEDIKSVHFQTQENTVIDSQSSQTSEKSCCSKWDSKDSCTSNNGNVLMDTGSMDSEFQTVVGNDTLTDSGPALMNAEDILDATKGEFD